MIEPGSKTLNFFKTIYRLMVYGNERRKQAREIPIRIRQNRLLPELFNRNSKKLIIFFVPGADWKSGKDRISGGVLSIVSICEETVSLKNIHDAETILCTLRADHHFLKHQTFVNKTPVFRFGQIPFFFRQAEEVTLHVPEFMVTSFLSSLRTDDVKWLKRKKKVHINIMNQNISLMPPPKTVETLKLLAPITTITTAHQKYCTREFRTLYGVPIHKFSVWISPEKYFYKKWHQKEDLIVVSPDLHPARERILEHLQRVKGLRIQVIQDLTYEAYKELISKAKWSLTFGEGLDGYFIEPVFSGAVSFAVYNEEFFTPDFRSLPTVYRSYDELLENICVQISELNDAEKFEAHNKQQFDLCARYYSHDTYRDNIKKFYQGLYTFS